jgi:signal transduction histidine kinase
LIVTGDAVPTSAVLSRRMFWLMLSLVVPLAAVAGGLGVLPLWHSAPYLALSLTALCTSFVAIGMVLLAEPGQSAAGWAMMLSATLLIVSWSNEWAVGPLPLASKVAGDLWLVVGGWALYRYPNHRLSTGDNWIFRLMITWFVVTSWLLVFLSKPQWHRFPAGWWPTLFPDRPVYEVATHVVDAGEVVLAALYVVRWVVQLRHATPAERRLKKPTGIAAIVAVCVGAAGPVAHLLSAADPVVDVLYTVSSSSILCVPVAFLVSVIRRYLNRTAIVDVLLRGTQASSSEHIVTELRRVFADPALQILFDPIEEEHPDRLAVEIRASDGSPLALMLVDKALGLDPDLVEAAAEAVRLNLENARLLERVSDQYDQLRVATRREAQATAAERRRIQHDLHDGIQGRLAALAPRLGAAIARTNDPGTAEYLRDVRDRLTETLADLRRLASGIRPAALDLGLASAFGEIIREHRLDAVVDLPDDALPDAVQQGAYLAVSEVITNVVKHARATKIRILGRMTEGSLEITVTDNGIGGARSGEGTGLHSVRDRTRALGGEVEIDSPPGQGTRVTMRIPCV